MTYMFLTLSNYQALIGLGVIVAIVQLVRSELARRIPLPAGKQARQLAVQKREALSAGIGMGLGLAVLGVAGVLYFATR